MISKTQQVFLDILKGDIPSQLEGVDTNELFELFRRHRLFSLAPVILDQLNEEIRQKWKQTIQSRTLKSLHYTSLLGGILQNLKKEGIDALPLKGPVLAQTLYLDTGQRQFRDLDLYLKREDIDAALNFLLKSGYELLSPKRKFSRKQWNYYYRYKYDVGLINRELGVVIELHIGLYYPGLFEASKQNHLWKAPEVVQMGQTRVSSMNRENTFLYLSIHGAHHLYFRLFWLRDIAEGLRQWDLDHRGILEAAKELKVERLLMVSILLANSFFEIEIPEAYKSQLAREEKRLNKLTRICTNAILGPEIPGLQGKLERLNFYLNLQPGMKYRWLVLENFFHRWFIRKFLDR